MAKVLKAQRAVEKSLKKSLKKRIDSALVTLGSHGDHKDVVHKTRQQIKKARAVTRLARLGLGSKRFKKINEALRDTGRPLAKLRDADVLEDTLDRLLEHSTGRFDKKSFEPVYNYLLGSQRKIQEHYLNKKNSLKSSTKIAKQARHVIQDTELRASQWKTLGSGLEKSFSHGKKALTATQRSPDTKSFHELRKQAKYLRYELEFLCPLSPRPISEMRDALHDLTDLLGEDHDLANLHETLTQSPSSDTSDNYLNVTVSLIAERREETRKQANELAAKIYENEPSAFERRIHRYWKDWRKMGEG